MSIELKTRLSEFVHKKGGKDWLAFFYEYKNGAQNLGMSIMQRFCLENYPEAYKVDGDLRKDWRKKMNLSETKQKKIKKGKPEPILEEEVEE